MTGARFLFVSDLHYEREERKGVNQSAAWSWLMDVVDEHGPDALLGAGDWGTAVSEEEFGKLLEKTYVLTIFGNHDDLEVLGSLRNRDGTPVLIEDCRIYEVFGVRVAGFNGICALRRKSKAGVPRRRPEEFLEAAGVLEKLRTDVLLVHEVPAFTELYPWVRVDACTTSAKELVERASTRIVLNGHVHASDYTVARLANGSLYVRVDSSQKSRCYAELDWRESVVRVYVDGDLEEEVPF